MSTIAVIVLAIVILVVYSAYKVLDFLTQDALEYEQKIINERKAKIKKGDKNEM